MHAWWIPASPPSDKVLLMFHGNGYVLEQAAEHYIRFVAPTQNVVRPEIMTHVRRSMNKNRKLLQLLAE